VSLAVSDDHSHWDFFGFADYRLRCQDLSRIERIGEKRYRRQNDPYVVGPMTAAESL